MYKNELICGEATVTLAKLPDHSVGLVVTDPPYLVNYRDRSGRSLKNDNNPAGVLPVFPAMARVMKRDSYALCFAGWSALPQFTNAWEQAGLRIVGQIVFQKPYTSRQGYAAYRHETAYILAKGNPAKPAQPIADVQDWVYSGNRRHPTEKAVDVLTPLIRCFSKPGDLVLDPFAGSGSTCVAAALTARDYLGIELDAQHCRTAQARLDGVASYRARQTVRAA